MKKFGRLSFCLLLSILLIGCSTGQADGIKPTEQEEKAVVQSLVEDFGKKLQTVSLLAPEENIRTQLTESYAPYISPELLAKWQAEPQLAPGRTVSSPWPDRIDILEIYKTGDFYLVKGEIIEITSVELNESDFAAKRPVSLKIKKINDNWLIDEVTIEVYEEQTPAESVFYKNEYYGFQLDLLDSWQGYKVISENWQGLDINGKENATFTGPLLIIRHPEWTEENPRQDIPIMVFTTSQWLALENEEFHIGAAPIGPKLLARNDQYVFALPARYNFSFPTGYEEVEEILAKAPLKIIERTMEKPAIAGISLGDSKETVLRLLGTEYKSIKHDEAGHFPEPFSILEYPEGLSIVIGAKSNTVLEITSISPAFSTNLGIKVGDVAKNVLPLYRSRYEEPVSSLGPKLYGVFKLEDGSALLIDFNKEDGIVNPEPISDTDKVERIILTKPAYLDDSF